MFRIFFTALLLLLLCPVNIFSQNDFLRVTAPGNRQLRLAITPPVPLAAEQDFKSASDIAEILQFDLAMTGIFQTTLQATTEKSTGMRPGEFNIKPGATGDADLLIKTGYLSSADSITIEYRLYELQTGRELLAKRYSAAKQDMRRTAHTFSDDVIFSLTGERTPFTSKMAFVSRATGNKEIYLMDWDGYNVRKLTANGSINLNPDFSPSGKELIYTSYKNGNPDLYRRELVSGSEIRISSRQGINITGAYSPEGNRVALAMSKDGNSEIYLVSKEGKQLARLTNNSSIDISPAWSPDGRFIVFVSDRLGKPQLFIMNFDGSDQRRLTTSGAYNVSPRWSPKGDRIAYCRQYAEGFQIHLINPDGSDDKQITFEGSNEHPRWSPDGRFIVFSSNRSGTESIFVMRADGSGQTKISRGKNGDSHPAWSKMW